VCACVCVCVCVCVWRSAGRRCAGLASVQCCRGTHRAARAHAVCKPCTAAAHAMAAHRTHSRARRNRSRDGQKTRARAAQRARHTLSRTHAHTRSRRGARRGMGTRGSGGGVHAETAGCRQAHSKHPCTQCRPHRRARRTHTSARVRQGRQQGCVCVCHTRLPVARHCAWQRQLPVLAKARLSTRAAHACACACGSPLLCCSPRRAARHAPAALRRRHERSAPLVCVTRPPTQQTRTHTHTNAHARARESTHRLEQHHHAGAVAAARVACVGAPLAAAAAHEHRRHGRRLCGGCGRRRGRRRCSGVVQHRGLLLAACCCCTRVCVLWVCARSRARGVSDSARANTLTRNVSTRNAIMHGCRGASRPSVRRDARMTPRDVTPTLDAARACGQWFDERLLACCVGCCVIRWLGMQLAGLALRASNTPARRARACAMHLAAQRTGRPCVGAWRDNNQLRHAAA
jgi:hypothetical protein